MRIGLSGPLYGSKLNLIVRLGDTLKFKNYTFGDTTSYTEPDNTSGIHRQVYELYMQSHFITPCTTFDTVVNAKHNLKKELITEDQYVELGKAWLNTMEMYNVIFYMPPNEEEEKNLSEDIMTLWSWYDRAIIKYEVPVVELIGTNEERFKQFKKVFV